MAISLPLARLIHENLSVVMTHVFSRKSLEALFGTRLRGEWDDLQKAVLDIAEERATRACLELAYLLRVLGDEQGVNYRRATALGRLVKSDKSEEPLNLREVSNKIIHASSWDWDVSDADDPKLVCNGGQNERWKTAEIDLISLAAFCAIVTRDERWTALG